MPLTVNQLKENPALKDLSPEQLQAAVTLANNVAQADLDTEVGIIHSRYDADIKEVTGRDKPDGMKTYAHLKSVLTELQSAGAGDEQLKADLKDARTKITRLETKIANGDGDAALKTQLATEKRRADAAETQIAQLKKDHEDVVNELNGRIDNAGAELETLRWTTELSQARGSLTFREDLSDSIMKTQHMGVDAIMNSYTRKIEVDTNGKERYVYYQGDKRVNNPETMAPATTEEILRTHYGDAVAEGRQQGGAGSGAGAGAGHGAPGAGHGAAFSLNGYATQADAADGINQHLSAQGLDSGTEAHSDEFNKIWDEQVVPANLPVQ